MIKNERYDIVVESYDILMESGFPAFPSHARTQL